MSPQAKLLRDQALDLGEEDRAELAGALLATLETSGAEALWPAMLEEAPCANMIGEAEGPGSGQSTGRLHRAIRDARDLEILNRCADDLNHEIEDVLAYQVDL